MATDLPAASVDETRSSASLSSPGPVAEAEARARAFQALHEIAVAVGGLLDTAALVELITERARALLGIDGAAVYWWNPDAERLYGLRQNGPRVAPAD